MFAGSSISVPWAVTESGVDSSIVWSAMAANEGALLTSLTVNAMGESVFATPSKTRTAKLYVELSPCASLGVQLNAPVEEMLAPLGAPTSENDSVSPALRI